MAQQTIRTGGRGRPLTIDIEQSLDKYFETIHKATARLEKIRKETKGYRGEAVLGTYTELPDFALKTLSLLEEAQWGRQLSYAEAREIRSSLKTLEQLSSKQERVYGRALADQLTTEYQKAMDIAGKSGRSLVNRVYGKIGQNLQALTPKQRQDFFLSRDYQDPRSTGRYKRIKDWAENAYSEKYGTDRTLTYDEAWAITFADRMGVDW